MTEEKYEEIVMGLVGFAGEGRSLALEALKCLRTNDLTQADALLKQARQTLFEAHHIQTDLIQSEINGEKMPTTLLMIHAQDHLMTAMLACDLIEEIIAIRKTNP